MKKLTETQKDKLFTIIPIFVVAFGKYFEILDRPMQTLAIALFTYWLASNAYVTARETARKSEKG